MMEKKKLNPYSHRDCKPKYNLVSKLFSGKTIDIIKVFNNKYKIHLDLWILERSEGELSFIYLPDSDLDSSSLKKPNERVFCPDYDAWPDAIHSAKKYFLNIMKEIEHVNNDLGKKLRFKEEIDNLELALRESGPLYTYYKEFYHNELPWYLFEVAFWHKSVEPLRREHKNLESSLRHKNSRNNVKSINELFDNKDELLKTILSLLEKENFVIKKNDKFFWQKNISDLAAFYWACHDSKYVVDTRAKERCEILCSFFNKEGGREMFEPKQKNSDKYEERLSNFYFLAGLDPHR